jgi:hypothetical protein
LMMVLQKGKRLSYPLHWPSPETQQRIPRIEI